jgi:hypothetical protein
MYFDDSGQMPSVCAADVVDQLGADWVELECRLALAAPLFARLQLHQVAEAVLELEIHAVHRPGSRRRFHRTTRAGRDSARTRPIIPAMMWISPIWNAETPVNMAARRTCGASWRARGGVVEKVWGWSGKRTSSTACQKGSPARVPHRLHVPGARQFEFLQPHLRDARTSFTARSTLP